MSLLYLSTELLTKIFEYCDIPELYNLLLTCKRFYLIINEATNLGNVRPLLVTNQLEKRLKRRSMKLLTMNEKFLKLKHWENGLYKEYCLLREKKKYMPRVVLTKDTLWISKANKITGYKRNVIGISLRQADIYSVPIPFESDVSSFVYKENCILTGQLDGNIYIKQFNQNPICIKSAHDSDVHCVDLVGNTFVSGSKSGFLKFWNLEPSHSEVFSQQLGDRIWSVALSKSGEHVGAGTAKVNTNIPLHIFDINSCRKLYELGETLPSGTGLPHLKWETPNILLSCGYDSKVHKWDLRCNVCVQSWKDPFLASVYCFDTDDYCTLVTGLATNGRAVLWDMRMPSYVQMYFMGTKKTAFSSPIYSLSFDVDHLFAATDCCLSILHFSLENISKNYNKSVLPFIV